MIDPTLSAYIFCFFTAVIMIFQLALALGAPWGEMAMGGKFPGRFPPKMRVAAIVQLVLLFLMALIVLVRAKIVSGGYIEISESAVWFVVGLSVVSSVMNIITPSKKERILWAPIAIILLISSLTVALS